MRELWKVGNDYDVQTLEEEEGGCLEGKREFRTNFVFNSGKFDTRRENRRRHESSVKVGGARKSDDIANEIDVNSQRARRMINDEDLF